MLIILDSPLASRFTEVYRQLQPFWDAEAQKRLQQGRSPLEFVNLLTVDSHAQHLSMIRHLQQSGRLAIVIAASGMCAGGHIVNYLKALLDDPRHNVLFVGYQAKGAPGQTVPEAATSTSTASASASAPASKPSAATPPTPTSKA